MPENVKFPYIFEQSTSKQKGLKLGKNLKIMPEHKQRKDMLVSQSQYNHYFM